MRKYLFLSMCMFFLSSITFAETELKGSPDELLKYLKIQPDTVTISAEATFDVQASRAVVMVSVITEDSLLKQSLKDNQNLRKEIIQTLNQSGISSEKISGTKFSSTPKYGIFGKKPSSYKVENVLKITVENETEFQNVALIIDSYKEVYYRELKFEHEDKENNKIKALEKAFDILANKKSVYEKRLGITLLPKNFIDGNAPPREMLEGVSVKKVDYDKITSSLVSDGASGTPIFGELTFTASIRVEFFVKQKIGN